MLRIDTAGGFAAHLQNDQDIPEDTEKLRAELERLLCLGDHLIRDIGLDPDDVRQWLMTSADESRLVPRNDRTG